MSGRAATIEPLISLPPRMAALVPELQPAFARQWFVASDPANHPLGSGGGTAHLLVEAWRASGGDRSFVEWLRSSRKLIMHAGGQSRRLPAYAAVGKAFIPVPVMRWSVGQRLDQTLVDLQQPLYESFLRHSSSQVAAMLTSGDVILRCDGALPAFPAVDVLVLGLWVTPEKAQHHGVFFCPRQQPGQLAFSLQKPSLTAIEELAEDYLFLIDTGVWLFSERAVLTLLAKCGWDARREQFAHGHPNPYELYATGGPCLGTKPTVHDPAWAALTSTVLPLPQGEFYHFGTSRHLIESVATLQNLVLDQTKLGLTSGKPHPDQHTQNSSIAAELGPDQRTLWIENAAIPATWQLAREHVLTGIPDNDWRLSLEAGVCLDWVPVGADRFCLRCYGLDDPFRGPIGQPATRWLGRAATEWFAARGVSLAQAGIDPATDIHDAPLFPVGARQEFDGAWLSWLFARQPAADPVLAKRWLAGPRLSGQELAQRADLRMVAAQRLANTARVLRPLAEHHRRSIFYNLDLNATARLYAATPYELPPPLAADASAEPLKQVHDFMFRAAVERQRGGAGWEQHESRAFALLRDLILREMELEPVQPTCTVLEDQIIWGRSPVRLDLAGGWTDTPPYCLQQGGRVLNVAVDLNGQPPIQVFARRIDQPEFVVRSIDLGLEERVNSYEQLAQYAQVGSGFTIAKAAFALAGFLPRFLADKKRASLADQLREFGGGIEVALLCAVPKGSGLGTSSILAATLLGTLGELCGLNWDDYDLFRRTLALEQMLTAGGGWQDQAGGLLRGIKLIETLPGLEQKPTVRWLPEHFFGRDHADRTLLLYYTGITRVAKEILKEIVRGMFLNSQTHLALLQDIGRNALFAADALQRENYDALGTAIQRSWDLNQRLDGGTNPPAVQAILDRIQDQLAACKLLGAGGGGYLLMLAKDEAAGRRIREILTTQPPNAKARFVSLHLSETGFQVTRS